MILSIKNDNISLEPITQVCGTNIKRKNAIINNIAKYFLGSKYAEYDEMQAYDIRVDDKVVGRKYFNVYRIKSKEDLVCGIEISKTSLMRMLMYGREAQDMDSQPCRYSEVRERNRKIHSCMLYLISI
jgi:hypothetical protein